MKKTVSVLLAASLLIHAAISFAAEYNSTTYFDEWDWQNKSSRYTRQAERLDRGLVAVQTDSGVFLSWRLNGYESENVKFNIYRDGVIITAEPVYLTNYTDTDGTADSTYSVGLVVDGTETEVCDSVSVLANQYKEIKVAAPPVISTSTNTEYSLNDVEVADLNGDGKYDFLVKYYPSDQLDAGYSGRTDHTYLDAYTSEGEHMWRIDLGANIRSGAHEIQPILYDYNGDGAAELAVMTADGTVALRPNKDGNGTYGNFGGKGGSRDYNYDVISVIGDPREVGKAGGAGRWTVSSSSGTNVAGPLYLTVFDGLSGEEIDTVPYDPQTTQQAYVYATQGYAGEDTTVTDSNGTIWTFTGYDIADGAPEYNTGAKDGLSVYNSFPQSGRFSAGVAYINGTTPSMVFQRGIYSGRVTVSAYNLIKDENGNEKIKQEWRADSYDIGTGATSGINAQGYHNVSVGDIDGSGKDSFIIGASAIKYDGTLLWSTQRGHGDAQHLGKYDPTLPGLQWFGSHEKSSYGFSFIDAATGKDLVTRRSADADTGRGIIGIWGDCVDGAYAYMSAASTSGSYAYKNDGTTKSREEMTEGIISEVSDLNYRIYWNGDLWDDVLDGVKAEAGNDTTSDVEMQIHSYDSETNSFDLVFETDGCLSTNGTKKNPCTVADIFGDWREELVVRTADNSALRIYTTTYPTDYRFYTFMHDALYRVSVARQNSAYNQPPHIGFYLADKDGYRDLQPDANIYLTNGGIKFTIQPQDNKIMMNDSISGTLKAEAVSYPESKNITYQWYVSSNGEETALSGETGTDFVIPTNLNAGDYSFYCKATDGDSVSVSSASEITILDSRQLIFLSQPEDDINAYEGKVNKTIAVATQVFPEADVSYQWYVAESDNTEGTAIDGATASSFTLPTDLAIGEYYYYCTAKCADTDVITSERSHVTVHSISSMPDPVTGAYNSENSRYEWIFNTLEATSEREIHNYTDKFASIRVGLGVSDAITFYDGTEKSGIYFSDPSVKETNTDGYKSVSDTGRYFMIKPAYDGTLNVTMKFTSAASNKANRIYYKVYDDTEFDSVDLSALQKGGNDHIGNSTSTDVHTASLEVTAGKTYVFYTYQSPSYISELNLVCPNPDVKSDDEIIYNETENTIIAPKDGTLIIGEYNSEGRLISVIFEEIKADIPITPTIEITDMTKMYLWDSIQAMIPLANSWHK